MSATTADALVAEVASFVAEHGAGVGAPVDAADLTYEQFLRNRTFHRALGERGWYAPQWPGECGGGGLAREAARQVTRELVRQLPKLRNLAPPGDIVETAAHAVWVLGSVEQKRNLLPRMLRGEVVVWELYTEPEAGSDLPSLKTRAVAEGEDYIVTGTKTLVGGHFSCDYFLCLAVTDPAGPRRKNLSAFLIPWGLDGVSITNLDMIAGSQKRTIVFDGVRVPATCRVGPEGKGWAVFTGEKAPRAFGRVGLGPPTPNDLAVLEDVLGEWRAARASEGDPALAPARSRRATELWVQGEIQRMLRDRLRRMGLARAPITYEVAQAALIAKMFRLHLSEGMHELLGPVAGVREAPWSRSAGELEYYQRYAILATHPGGTVEIQKLRMFRGLEEKAGAAGGERS